MQRLGVAFVVQGDGPALSGVVLDGGQPAVITATPTLAEPSWGRVIINTIKLWVLWRLRLIVLGSARAAGKQTRGGPLPRRPRRRRQGTVWRWRLAAIVAAMAIGAAAALAITGMTSPAARVLPSGDNSAGAPAGRPGTASGNAPVGSVAGRGPAATVRSVAAAWIAAQLSAATIIACDPAMCAALQAAGVNAGQLMPVPAGTADPGDAEILVTPPMAGRLAGRYGLALIASFGSGATSIEVRATEPGGAAAYAAALRADLAARKSAGSELLRNWRIAFTAQDARQLRAGQVDSRLLATLAALTAKYPIRVDAFGDAAPGVTAPGAALPLRGVTITITGGQNRTVSLAAALALVRSQSAPYQPAHAAIVYPAATQAALNVEFAAPSPLGLLTAVLAVHQRVSAG
jgi:hypothetical protein